jgi:hypothetical protein
MTTTPSRCNSFIFCTFALILAGCTHHHAALDTSKCPKAEPLNPTGWTLGVGNYEAQVVQDDLVVQANGENPDVNYEEKLALQMPDMFPPKFALYMRKSQGAGVQSLTDFKVCTKYRLSPSQSLQIKSVIVTDEKGDHTVPLELVKK